MTGVASLPRVPPDDEAHRFANLARVHSRRPALVVVQPDDRDRKAAGQLLAARGNPDAFGGRHRRRHRPT